MCHLPYKGRHYLPPFLKGGRGDFIVIIKTHRHFVPPPLQREALFFPHLFNPLRHYVLLSLKERCNWVESPIYIITIRTIFQTEYQEPLGLQ